MWRESLHSGSCSVALLSQLCVCRRPHTSLPLERPFPGWYWPVQLFPRRVHHLCTNIHMVTVGDSIQHVLSQQFKHLRSFSNTDFINPFLSLSLVNMSSDRAVFITYSSALVISVMELRRRQGTRNMPFFCVAWVSQFPISEVSLFGFQGRICILNRRGRMFRRIWRLTQGQSIIQWQPDL